MEPESNVAAGVEDDAHVLDIDPRQLARILTGVEPAAEFVDQHGMTLQITAEQLIEAGLTLDALEGAGVVQFEEHAFQEEANGSQFYLINGNEDPVLQRQYGAVPELKAEQPENAQALKAEDGAPPPPVLSASLPLTPLSRMVPTQEDLNDPEKLRILIDETRREIQEKEKRYEDTSKRMNAWERRSRLIATALVKTMNFEEEKVLPVCLSETPDIPVANVLFKRFEKEPSPSDSVVVHMESGEQCFIQVEKLSERQSSPTSTNKEGGSSVNACDRCPRRFPNQEQLKQHQEMVHPHKGTFYCRFCEREVFFPNDANFQAHIRLCHKGMMEREASIQGESNADDEVEEEPDWETIFARSDSEQECMHKCSICRKDFATALLGRQHVQEDHGISDVQRALSLIKPSNPITYDYRCVQCDKAYSRPEMLEKHNFIHRKPEAGNMPFTCRFCGKTFKWNENLQKHLTSHDSQEPVQCPECNQMFSNSTRLDVHYKARHATRGHQFPCTFCLKTFAVKDALTKHMLSHGQWRCNECGKRFADELFLRRHQSTHSAQDFVCDVCEKVFARPENLSAHRNIHTGEKPYVCSHCPLRFTSRSNCKSHVKWHTSEMPFACNNCNRKFKTKATLDCHVELHKQRKPFSCTACYRSFDRPEYLYTHCAGRRPSGKYTCQNCVKIYYNKGTLKLHAASHGTSLPFTCTTCDRAFPTKERTQAHMRSHVDQPEKSHLIFEKVKNRKEFRSVTYVGSGEEPVDVKPDQLIELTRKWMKDALPPFGKAEEEIPEAKVEIIDEKVAEEEAADKAAVEEVVVIDEVAADSSETAQSPTSANASGTAPEASISISEQEIGDVQMEVEIVGESMDMF
uniref:C2H2-type domain-containing protein n=1 Tax=Trichuris muris TaxID=70415 RepID=A0A5S6QCU8_TRIMR